MNCPRFLSSFALLTLISCSGAAPVAPVLDKKYQSVSGDSQIKPSSSTPESGTVPTLPTSDEVLNRDTSMPSSVQSIKDAMTPMSNQLTCDDGELDIVGGVKATDTDLVSASTFRIIFNRNHYCTATLVGPNQLVTAAHCFEDVDQFSKFEIGFGPHGENTNFRVQAYRIHPDYKGMQSIARAVPTTDLSDIALVSFKGRLTAAMKPAKIAQTSLMSTGMQVVVAGYGAAYTTDTSARPLAWTITKISSISKDHKEFQIEEGLKRGACYGDSGGPTFLVGAGAQCLQLVGSISGPSRGTVDCDKGGGLSMDLTAYRNWIACNFDKMRAPLDYIPIDSQSCSDSRNR